MTLPPELPSGTVTFLFTDIEGSTRLLKRLREGYERILAEHQELLRAAFAAHGGQVVDSQGDSFFVAFRRAKDAVAAAAAAQNALQSHGWPEGVEVRVRMGIHTGQAEASGGRYHGLAVHRAARIGAAAHGGQVLVSQTTRELLEDEEDESRRIVLRDLGEQRLKDLDRPVRLYQLVAPGLPSELPPLREVATAPEAAQAVDAGIGWRRRLRLVVPVAVVVVGGVVAAVILFTRGSSGSAQASAGVAADSVGVFRVGSGKPVAQTLVRSGPGSVASGEGSLWVANVNDDSVSRVDPKTNAVVQTVSVGNGPTGVAVGGGFVWVANGLDGTVSKIDPGTQGVVERVSVGSRPAAVAFGAGGVWVANSGDRTVTRIDVRTGKPRTFSVDAGAVPPELSALAHPHRESTHPRNPRRRRQPLIHARHSSVDKANGGLNATRTTLDIRADGRDASRELPAVFEEGVDLGTFTPVVFPTDRDTRLGEAESRTTITIFLQQSP